MICYNCQSQRPWVIEHGFNNNNYFYLPWVIENGFNNNN